MQTNEGLAEPCFLAMSKSKNCLTPHQSSRSSPTASPHGGSSRARRPRALRNTVDLETFPRGGRWLHEVQTNEGLGGLLSMARLKTDSSAYPSSAECNRNGIRHTPREYVGHRPHLAALSFVCTKVQTSARSAEVERKRNGRSTFVAVICSFRS